MEKDPRVFIEEVVEELQKLHIALHQAYWSFTTEGTPTLQNQLQTCRIQLAKFLANKEIFQQINIYLDQLIDDERVNVQLQELYKLFLKNQIDPDLLSQIAALETSIESEFTNFRPTYNGKRLSNNQILEILHHSKNTDLRKAAYLSSKNIGLRVAPDLLKLVKLRNQAAQQLGFDNYYSLSLHIGDFEENQLFAILDELKEITDQSLERAKKKFDWELSRKFDIEPEELMPWHYSDPFFQNLPLSTELDLDQYFRNQNITKLSEKYFQGLGLEVSDILKNSDLYERENKDQHAYCIHINRSGDIRVLANLQNTETSMATILHELGHGLYEKYLDSRLPYILRKPAHSFLTESIAIMFGNQSRNPIWLKEVAGVQPELVDSIKNQLYWQEQLGLLIFIRWGLVMVYFEREMYKNPEQNLNKLWWDLVEKLQHITRPPNRENRADWAAKIHLSSFPAYYHNYILGYLGAYQIEAATKEYLEISTLIDQKSVGMYLIDNIFKAGSRKHWNEILKDATGHYLTPEFITRILC